MKTEDTVNFLLEIEKLKQERDRDRQTMADLAAWKKTLEEEKAARIGRFVNELNEYFVKHNASISEVLAALTLMSQQHSAAFVAGQSAFK